jgi:hypothetical protein
MQNNETSNCGAALLSKDGYVAVKKAQTLLSWSAISWRSVLIFCQLIFVTYLISAYANPALSGNLVLWNGNSTSAFVPNGRAGNTAFGMQVLLAIIMILGGPLQLIPA